jgi:phenylpyruvate tautomerase PptA (4-oxalocrotonate tautomerase family)
MAQVKIYGIREKLNPVREKLSEAIHSSIVDAFQFPADKKFQRFIALPEEDFIFASGRSDAYTILEISMFEGRSVEAKKQLIRLLFQRVEEQVGIAPNDLEITLFETPKHNWGIRGLPADELSLNYKVNV